MHLRKNIVNSLFSFRNVELKQIIKFSQKGRTNTARSPGFSKENFYDIHADSILAALLLLIIPSDVTTLLDASKGFKILPMKGRGIKLEGDRESGRFCGRLS